MKQMNLYATLLAALLLCCSCLKGIGSDEDMNAPDRPQIPTQGELVLTATPDVIEADGEEAAVLTLTKGGVEVPNDLYTLYDGENNPVSLPDGRFTTTEKGFYYFWAQYGNEYTETIRVKAVEPTYDPDGPGGADDPNAESTSFVRRVLLTQFTGTGCGYCPQMMACLQELMQDGLYANQCVIAAIHRYNTSDPMYLVGAPINEMLGVGSYPSLFIDFFYAANSSRNVDYVKHIVNSAISRAEAPAGISGNAVYDSETRVISLTATVKAAITNKFRVGVWVVEDDIYAAQTNYGTQGNFNTHHNAVRLVDSEDVDGEFRGHDLGEIAKGATASKDFALKLDESWDANNCRLIIFVTSEETIMSSGREVVGYFIGNVITMPISGEKPFEYLPTTTAE